MSDPVCSNRPKQWYQRVEVIMVDGVHKVGEEEISEAIEAGEIVT